MAIKGSGLKKGQMVKDPFGHAWAIVTVKEEVTPEQVEERMNQFMEQMERSGSQ